MITFNCFILMEKKKKKTTTMFLSFIDKPVHRIIIARYRNPGSRLYLPYHRTNVVEIGAKT
jgi:hypothetical protein